MRHHRWPSAVVLSVLIATSSTLPTNASHIHSTDAGVDGEHIFAGVSYNNHSFYESCRWAVPETTYRLGVRAGLTTREWNGVVWHLYSCERDDASTLVWIPQITVEEVAESTSQMVRQLVPTLTGVISPAPTQLVVLLPVWFWIPAPLWVPVSVTAALPTPRGVVTVTTTATPSAVRYDPGDDIGEAVECDGPGLPWSRLLPSFVESDCTYEYTRPSSVRGDDRFRANLGVVWEVRWRSNMGVSGRLPDIRLGVPVSVRVRELHAVVAR